MAENFAALSALPFAGEVNVVLHPRRISGDFNALAQRLRTSLPSHPDMRAILRTLNTIVRKDDDADRHAAAQILNDFSALTEDSAKTELRIVASLQDSDADVLFHTDRISNQKGRLICCYNDPVTEWIANDEACAAGKGLYRPVSEDVIRRFQPGDIWRFACRGNTARVEPFLHRSPPLPKGSTPRLLLVVDYK